MPHDEPAASGRERGRDLLLPLDRGAREPLRAQIERQLRDGIRDGRLLPDTVLPSTRALAGELGVSRGVVVEAFAQLAAEGFIGSRPGGKTRVQPVPSRASAIEPARGYTSAPAMPSAPGPTSAPGSPETPGATTVAPSAGSVPPGRVPLPGRAAPSTGPVLNLLPMAGELTAFPRQAWLRSLRRALDGISAPELSYGDLHGPAPAREILATYLARSRGVAARAETTVFVAGVTHALGLIARVLVARGVTTIAVEDPGFLPHRVVLENAGLRVAYVGVDENGLLVADLEHADVGAVLVTPAHQSPLGWALSAARRTALVGWAARNGAVVIEDDYDGEFRYDGAAIGALQALAPDHVLYLGSVSKTLAPALRIGWIVAPRSWLDELASRRFRQDGGATVIEPSALAQMIDRGEYDRHLRAQRRRYADRRAAVLAALAAELPEAEVIGVAAGLHVTVVVSQQLDPAAVMSAAAERGLLVLAGARASRRPDAGTLVVVGFGQLPDGGVERAMAMLAAAVRQAGAAAPQAEAPVPPSRVSAPLAGAATQVEASATRAREDQGGSDR